ncbi:hypothetical protein TNCV_3911251 [Trichonephila clavipes]|nr:hypothetical protein TNCV_3911251 [Trichonephila clavipes]
MSPIRSEKYIIASSRRKILDLLPGLESLSEKKGFVSYEDLSTINRTKYPTFQEAAIATGVSKSENFIREVLENAASLMNLTASRMNFAKKGTGTKSGQLAEIEMTLLIWIRCAAYD